MRAAPRNSVVAAGLTLVTRRRAPGASRMLFPAHAANDAFVGAAHWAILPYCTQDFHAGRRSGPAQRATCNV